MGNKFDPIVRLNDHGNVDVTFHKIDVLDGNHQGFKHITIHPLLGSATINIIPFSLEIGKSMSEVVFSQDAIDRDYRVAVSKEQALSILNELVQFINGSD